MITNTLPRVFIEQLGKNRDNAFLMYKDGSGLWQEVSWQQVGDVVKEIAMGLIALGVAKGDRVSGISNTKPVYAYCCTAIANIGAVFAPIYQTNSPAECAHVINDAGSRIVFAEDRLQCEKILAACQHTHPIDTIIVFEPFQPIFDDRIITLDQLKAMGRDLLAKRGDQPYDERIAAVRPEDVTAIIYTSGTTGPPKGVVDTNAGILRNLDEYVKIFPLASDDRGLSFLPMAHALELRNGHWYHIRYGLTQVYAGSIRTVYDDVRETGVTFFFTTPRFFEKNYNAVQTMIRQSPPWKKALFDWCIRQGARHHNGSGASRPLLARTADNIRYVLAWHLFIKKIRQSIGSRLRYSAVGGAPAAHDILRFFMACGLPLYEGYGLTEAVGMVSTNCPRGNKIGTVGQPTQGVEVKIATDGEMLVKGWIWTKGYWNNTAATEALFRDGWLNTGDVGLFDDDGYLKITGRKKEILITSGGKNISPSYVENILKMSSMISQAVVFGEGKDYLTALVTLNQEEVIGYAEEHQIAYQDFKDLIRNPEIVNLIHSEIEKQNKELSRVEQVRRFSILEEEFRQDRDEVTPTFKIKRRIISQRYEDAVAAMYAPEPGNAPRTGGAPTAGHGGSLQ